MTLDNFRNEMRGKREHIDQEARLEKDSQSALDLLYEMYRAFSEQERVLAHQVLNEWLMSEDENLRFDALAIIDEFKIADTEPALNALTDRLVASNMPSSPYELAKVRRILHALKLP